MPDEQRNAPGSALLLAPHNDDETLFAAFTCMRFRPYIVTVLRSVNQAANGITAGEREAETDRATTLLGCVWDQWPEPDDAPDWDAVREMMEMVSPPRVFAPWPEKGGHEQHNKVGELAEAVFGSERVTFYTTYRYGGPRTTGREVEPDPWMIPLKLRALACYESQMLRGPRRFFMDALNEYELP